MFLIVVFPHPGSCFTLDCHTFLLLESRMIPLHLMVFCIGIFEAEKLFLVLIKCPFCQKKKSTFTQTLTGKYLHCAWFLVTEIVVMNNFVHHIWACASQCRIRFQKLDCWVFGCACRLIILMVNTGTSSTKAYDHRHIEEREFGSYERSDWRGRYESVLLVWYAAWTISRWVFATHQELW